MLTKRTKSLTMILLAFVMALTLCLGFSGFSNNSQQGAKAADATYTTSQATRYIALEMLATDTVLEGKLYYFNRNDIYYDATKYGLRSAKSAYILHANKPCKITFNMYSTNDGRTLTTWLYSIKKEHYNVFALSDKNTTMDAQLKTWAAEDTSTLEGDKQALVTYVKALPTKVYSSQSNLKYLYFEKAEETYITDLGATKVTDQYNKVSNAVAKNASGTHDVVISEAGYYLIATNDSSSGIGVKSVEVTATQTCNHANAERTPAKEATCTEAGNNAYWYCSDCEKYYKDDNGVIGVATTIDAETIPASHTLTKTEAKDATCKDGNIEYYTCSVCKKLFSDAEATVEIAEADIVIPATGAHDWIDLSNTATCTEPGTKGQKCANCDATQTVDIPALGHTLTKTEAKPATCTEDGNNAYWTCSVCKKVYADEAATTETTVEEQTIPATGHALAKTDANAATCTEDGNNEYYTCSVCGKFYSDAEGANEITEADIVIPATGHDNVNGACSVCGSVYTICEWKGLNYANDNQNLLNKELSTNAVDCDAWNIKSDMSFSIGHGVIVTAVGGQSSIDYKGTDSTDADVKKAIESGINYMIKNGSVSPAEQKDGSYKASWTNAQDQAFINITVPAAATIKITASNYHSSSSKRYCALKLNGVTAKQTKGTDENSLAKQTVFTFTVDAAGSYDLYNVQNDTYTRGNVYVSKIEVEFVKPVLMADAGASLLKTTDSKNLGLRFTFSLTVNGKDFTNEEQKNAVLENLSGTVTMYAYDSKSGKFKAATKEITTIAFSKTENNVIKISIIVVGVELNTDWFNYQYSAKASVKLYGKTYTANNFDEVGNGYTFSQIADTCYKVGYLTDQEAEAYGVKVETSSTENTESAVNA